MGPTAHYLTDVVLGLGVTDTPASPFVPSSVNAVVAAAAAGAPGAALVAMPYSITTPGDQAISVQDAGPVLLDANTNYWGIAHALGEFSGAWRLNSDGAMRLTAGQTNGNAWNLRPDDEIFALRVEGNRAVARTGNALSCRIESDGVAAKRTHNFLTYLQAAFSGSFQGESGAIFTPPPSSRL